MKTVPIYIVIGTNTKPSCRLNCTSEAWLQRKRRTYYRDV